MVRRPRWRIHLSAICLLLLPLFPSLAVAQTAADSAVAVVAAFHAALTRGDSTAALALLGPDAVILESGEVETLAEYRAHHLAADIAFTQAVPSSRAAARAAASDGVAWVMGTSTTAGTFQNRVVNSQNAELVVVSREPKGWLIRAIHWSSHNRRTPG